MTAPGRPEPTPLEREIASEPAIVEALLLFARRRSADASAARDLTQDALRLAIQQERAGKCWDPAGHVSALAHLAGLVRGLRANARRQQRRRPEAVPEEHVELASADPDPEAALLERAVHERRARIEEELRRRLAEDTGGAIPLAMLDAARQGVRGHAELATHLGCSIPEVRAAQKRITRHAMRLVESADASGPVAS